MPLPHNHMKQNKMRSVPQLYRNELGSVASRPLRYTNLPLTNLYSVTYDGARRGNRTPMGLLPANFKSAASNAKSLILNKLYSINCKLCKFMCKSWSFLMVPH